jgi:hypothetical protein
MDGISEQILLEKISLQIDVYKKNADIVFEHLTLKLKSSHASDDRFMVLAMNVIERYYIGILSIQKVIKEFKFYQGIKLPIALIIRSLLLDLITIEYLSENNNQGKFTSALGRVNYKAAYDTNKHCEESIRDGKLNPEDVDDYRNFIAELYPENFIRRNESTKFNNKIRPIKPIEMAMFLKDVKYRYGGDAYKHYLHYSNYAHFSGNSKLLMRLEKGMGSQGLTWSLFYIFNNYELLFDIVDVWTEPCTKIVNQRDFFLNLTNSFPATT